MEKEKKEIREMFDALSGAPTEVLPSKYWIELNRKNLEQLEEHGYENFKQTIALNYFTWTMAGPSAPLRYLVRSFPKDRQIRELRKNLSTGIVLGNIFRVLFFPKKHKFFTWTQSLAYNYFSNLLWDFTQKNDKENLLDSLDEPLEGNPPQIYRGKKLISQDLAHSVLEYYSAIENVKDKKEIKTIIELGAGYGRTAYVFLKTMPKIRYIIVDIPPALWIAQKYLSEQFPERKIFKFRDWNSFEDIKDEFQNADIIFLLSSQLELLPSKCTDIFVNISSLHEMRMDQITYYYKLIDRLTSGYFYSKQWKVSEIPNENVTIRESDYPVYKNWEKIYWRECKIQIRFFESLFKIE